MLSRLSAVGLFLAVLCGAPAAGAPQVLKIATVSPDGTMWMLKLRAGAAEIEKRTQGRVSLKFYPGGIMGNDQSVLRKIRIGQLHGGAVMGGSLAEIYPDLHVYGLPFLFRSLEEVDYVRARLDRELMRGLEERGYVTFGFAGGGFAYLMSSHPVRSLSELKGRKVWIPPGDVVSQTVLETAGISPVPLPISDVLTGLQTGLIETVGASPVAAIALQWHTKTRHLTDLPFSYLYAMLALDRKAFLRLAPEDRKIVQEEMTRAFREIDGQNRLDDKKATAALKQQGVAFVVISGEAAAEIKKVASAATERLRRQGVLTPGMIGSLEKHLNAYRAAKPTKVSAR
jgi:TRAP-type C4-dicarboxylate transport system substrate-binding protein